MISKHEFNTRWWGRSVGTIEGPNFFSLDVTTQNEMLDGFDWVEFKSPLSQTPPLHLLRQAGFVQFDVQLPFALNLMKVTSTPSIESLQARSAQEQPFEIATEKMASFTHERFKHLSGCTDTHINERYAMWANELVKNQPGTCLTVQLNEDIQGWFLASPGRAKRLHLTLAMLTKEAKISGLLLYQKACLEFAKKGYRIGEASFSITNTAVHNMYATLSARFLSPIGHWLWVSGREGVNLHV